MPEYRTFEQIIAQDGFDYIYLEDNESMTNYGLYYLDGYSDADAEAVWRAFADVYNQMADAGQLGTENAQRAFNQVFADFVNHQKGSASAQTSVTRTDNKPLTIPGGPGSSVGRNRVPNKRTGYAPPRALPEPPVHRDRRGGSEPQRNRPTIVRLIRNLFGRKRNR